MTRAYRGIPRTGGADQLEAASEALEVLNGTSGNGLDAAITRRELADIGIINLKRLGRGARRKVVIEAPPSVGGDVQTPPAPENVSATGAFFNILIEWSMQPYAGHAYAEIWRSDADDFGTATRVATTQANLYSDAVGIGASYFYWVRFVNTLGVAGPIQSTAGIAAETAEDISAVMEELSDDLYQVVNNLDAQWGIKTNIADIEGGIGLYNDGDKIRLLIQADTFALLNTDESVVAPFIVDEGVTYIDASRMRKADVLQLIAGSVVADYMTAAALLTAANIHSPKINMGALVKPDANDISTWYVDEAAGRQGNFSVDENGNMHATNAHLTSVEIYDDEGELVFGSGGFGELGNFASIDQITSSNVATLIANAAIGNAQIDTLAVDKLTGTTAYFDTVHLKDQAVTIPSSAYTGAGVDFDATEVTIQTLVIETTGAPIEFFVSATIKVTPGGGTSGADPVQLRLYQGTSVIHTAPAIEAPIVEGKGFIAFSFGISKVLPAGIHTIYLKAFQTGSAGQGRASARYLRALETKK